MRSVISASIVKPLALSVPVPVTKASLLRMSAPMATAMPRLVPAPLATVAVPSASVWALVTEVALTVSKPGVRT